MAKTKKRRRINIRGVLVVLLVIYLIGMFLYYLINLPIKNIVIKGTSRISDTQIIETAKLKNYPAIFKLNTIKMKTRIVVNNIAKSLRNMGFSISMDDFGTQYSNMAVLTQFDFDTVKIDRSMILNIVNNEKNKLILKHTVAMLKDLGITLILMSYFY